MNFGIANVELLLGLEIILVVTVMTLVVCPLLLWVLPDRLHQPNGHV
ncbi:hypothetical protein XM38_005710 [Halomicronema hongdechloris C2206]|uniref:Uncharacterized protein n=1 Tax=Halomicronema hongdechloris C2206 TaxID=1641165 RepID=A0A1Z3HH40_9CYAN|nr:hypothetical protein [Halomicronema hongdechloris]ASC69642.1 hypothetical protein XM38_005710 [Halomicronema hongdechloris C2206]